jgi:very-short-patch-repair endonuclease
MASGTVGDQYVTEEKIEDARSLRKHMTLSEAFLWEHLRNRKCGGFKFRRQQIIDGFIADFYCEQAQLVIEVDGGIHDDVTVKRNDKHRESVFKARGIITLRFKNKVVTQSINAVIAQIKEICEKNWKNSKLASWEKLRMKNSGAPLPSGEGSGVRS